MTDSRNLRKLAREEKWSKARVLRYILLYTLMLALVLAYYWLNRESANMMTVPEPAPQVKKQTTFQLEAPESKTKKSHETAEADSTTGNPTP